MPQDHTFEGVFLKLERADHHISKIELNFNRWLIDNRRSLQRRRLGQGGGGRQIGKPLPRHTSTILGDALHNLRAALDHCFCVLIEANGGKPTSHSKFPIRKTQIDCAAALNGQVKGARVSKAVADFIVDELQPYPGGKGEDIFTLHMLDIADKHTNLIDVSSGFQGTVVVDGVGIRVNATATGCTGSLVNIAGHQRFDFIGNRGSALKINFSDGPYFGGREILPTMKILQKVVDKAVKDLRSLA